MQSPVKFVQQPNTKIASKSTVRFKQTDEEANQQLDSTVGMPAIIELLNHSS